MKPRRRVLLGLAVFLLAAVVYMPAAQVYGWLAPQQAPVKLYGIEGSIFDGGAAAVASSDRRIFSDLHWKMSPWQLPALRLVYTLSSGGDGALLAVRLMASPGGVRMEDLRLSGAIRPLLPLLGQAYLPVDGQLGLNFSRLQLKNGMPTDAEGNARIHNLNWTLGRQVTPLGSFVVDVKPQGEELVFTLSPDDGPLEVDGGGSLDREHNYNVDISLKPRANADRNLANVLRSMGAPDAEGVYHIRRGGQLGDGADADVQDIPEDAQ